MPAGAVFGAPLGGVAADRLGRKNALLLSGIPNIIGWIIIALSDYSVSPGAFKGLILTGRAMTGFASGWLGATMPVSTVYSITLQECK